MTKRGRLKKTARRGLRGSPALAVAMLPWLAARPALAQTATGPGEGAAKDRAIEEILVTGSRLQRPDLVTPIPVAVIDKELISLSGATNVVDIVNELPALGQGLGAQNTFRGSNAVGTSVVNLRNLGEARTLVLVNGRRRVGGIAGSTAVDINTIAAALVERVEVSTGGASVSYGADAVTGVVNFILKDDFQGVVVDIQPGLMQRGDGQNYYGSITAGGNFLDDRGNAVVSVSYNLTGAIDGMDRQFVTRNTQFGNNPANTGPADGQPARIFYDDTRINITNQNGVLRGAMNNQSYTFDAAGNLVEFDPGTPIGGSFSAGGDGYDLARVMRIQNPTQRLLLDGKAHHRIASGVTAFLDATYSQVAASNLDQPTGDFFTLLDPANGGAFFTVSPDNPFLPDDSRLDALFAANPANPDAGFPGSSVLLSRFHEDLGIRKRDASRDLYRLVAGGRGGIADKTWRYEAYYQYGRTDVSFVDGSNRIAERFRLASDAVTDAGGVVPGNNPGDPACRATVQAFAANPQGSGTANIDECRPLNLFGSRRLSQEAIDFVSVDLLRRDQLEQHLASANLSGELFELPAGPVSSAFGVEWRREDSRTRPDPLSVQGLTFDGRVTPITGSYEVFESYAEARVPIVAGRQFAELLSAEGGARLSRYNTVGLTTTWRANGEWAPVEDLRFRGGYAVAVRAPNINELYTPASQTFGGVVDPCDAQFIDLGPDPARRRANCAELVPPGFRDPNAAVTKELEVSGNPDLAAEAAQSVTLGAVFAPRWISGLALTVDYFDITIEGAIDTPNQSTIAANCVDLFDTVNNEFCALIDRNPNTGAIDLVRLKTLNIAALEASGVDFNVTYRLTLADLGLGREAGTANLRLFGTWLDELNERPSSNPLEEDRQAGEIGSPVWRVNAQAVYRNAPFTFSWLLRYIGAGEFDIEDDPVETTDPQGFGAQAYSDAQLRYAVAGDVEVYLGVNNAFDNQPPRGSRRATSTASVLYDQGGRFFYTGVALRL